MNKILVLKKIKSRNSEYQNIQLCWKMFQKLKTWMHHLEQFQTIGKKMVIKFIFESNKKGKRKEEI